MSLIKNISQSNSSGKFVLSALQQFERKSNTEDPSIKMVLSGSEHYKVNGRNYTLGLDHFLLVDSNEWLETVVDAKKNVKGICIFPKKELLNQIVKTRIYSCQTLLDMPFENEDISLLHKLYDFKENRTGRYLQQHILTFLGLQENTKEIDFDTFYMQLAECLVDDQLELKGQLKKISSVKKETKEELYRRVFSAKNYISDNYTQNINLDDLARESYLSKYHFIRTFKMVFGLSPYQYLLQLRLKKAQQLILQDYSYNEVSNLIGFSDGKNLRKALLKLHSA